MLNPMKRVLLLMLLLGTFVFIVGLATDLRYSDETYHFFFAKDWFELGHRPVYLKHVNDLEEYGYQRRYVDTPLWHYGLQVLWRVTGHISENVAQFYQVLFYFFLGFFTYLLAKEMYGETAGWYAAIIVSTTPLIVSFSVLLYQEVPIAMFVPLCLLLLLKKRVFWAAVVMGLAFLLKRNIYLLFPAVLFYLLFSKNVPTYLSGRIRKVFLFLSVVLVITLSDFVFRYNHFRGIFYENDKGQVFSVMGDTVKGAVVSLSTMMEVSNTKGAPEFTNYVPGNITNISNILKYMGIPMFCLGLFYLVNIKKLLSRKETILLIPFFLYLFLFFIAFKGWLAMRLLSPIFPLVAVLVSKAFILLKNKILKYLIFVLCAVQFFGMLAFVFTQRKLSVDERLAFDYIKKEACAESKVLSPEEFSLFYYTNSPSIWLAAFHFVDKADSSHFLWGDDESEKKAILEKYEIGHIFIQKKRIYDDSGIRHFGGWPSSFVDRLPSISFLKKVFENRDVSIWKVQS